MQQVSPRLSDDQPYRASFYATCSSKDIKATLTYRLRLIQKAQLQVISSQSLLHMPFVVFLPIILRGSLLETRFHHREWSRKQKHSQGCRSGSAIRVPGCRVIYSASRQIVMGDCGSGPSSRWPTDIAQPCCNPQMPWRHDKSRLHCSHPDQIPVQ